MSEPSVKSDVLEQSALEEAASIQVLSETGEAVPFGSLFEQQKTIVVFIRHFLCGMCKLYVEELGKVPKSALDAAGTRIVVIGCGEWSVIKKYREDSNNYPYDIYAEPTRALHQKLGLLSNRYGAGPGEKRKSYAGKVLAVGLASLVTWIRKGYDITKVGNLSQVGGDFVLGPGSKVTFAARMKNTQDHVEIDDLMKAAGVAYSTGVSQSGLTG